MQSCDVFIVGGGPAGSTCAWKLCSAGLDVLIVDKHKFPRDKVCGGWITPPVLKELDIDAEGYARQRVLQPITGFHSSRMGGVEIETTYSRPVSFGIRRTEFDYYLLERSGARIVEGKPTDLQRRGDYWIVNGQFQCRLIVGAGGHFCPVAGWLGAKIGAEPIVAAQEVEPEMDARQQDECAIRPEIPELFFCEDMKGYGWCFRKGPFLNVGLGRFDHHRLSAHAEGFVDFLRRRGKIPASLQLEFKGHAYLLYGVAPRNVVADGMLLVGDAAGLAYCRSGEGIRPAIESGLLAAAAIEAARGDYCRARLNGYLEALRSRFGKTENDWTCRISQALPHWFSDSLGEKLLASRWFARNVLLDRWFLHAHEGALQV